MSARASFTCFLVELSRQKQGGKKQPSPYFPPWLGNVGTMAALQARVGLIIQTDWDPPKLRPRASASLKPSGRPISQRGRRAQSRIPEGPPD